MSSPPLLSSRPSSWAGSAKWPTSLHPFFILWCTCCWHRHLASPALSLHDVWGNLIYHSWSNHWPLWCREWVRSLGPCRHRIHWRRMRVPKVLPLHWLRGLRTSHEFGFAYAVILAWVTVEEKMMMFLTIECWSTPLWPWWSWATTSWINMQVFSSPCLFILLCVYIYLYMKTLKNLPFLSKYM